MQRKNYTIAIEKVFHKEEVSSDFVVDLSAPRLVRDILEPPVRRRRRNSYTVLHRMNATVLALLFLLNPVMNVHAEEVAPADAPAPAPAPISAALPAAETTPAPSATTQTADTPQAQPVAAAVAGSAPTPASDTTAATPAPTPTASTPASDTASVTTNTSSGDAQVASVAAADTKSTEPVSMAQTSAPAVSGATTTTTEQASTTNPDSSISTVISTTTLSTATSTDAPAGTSAGAEVVKATTTQPAAPSTEKSTTSSGVAVANTNTPQASSATPAATEVTPDVPAANSAVVDDAPTEVLPAPTSTVVSQQGFSIEPANKFAFGENDCRAIDDRGYYCVHSSATSTPFSSTDGEARVMAQKGTDGNKQIFLEKNGVRTQISSGANDNDAPAYDTTTSLAVWHSLISGRYQIMLFNGAAASSSAHEVKQLTDTPYNNTNPRIHGKSAVWQGWVEGNWQIFYAKDVTMYPLEVKQITATGTHNMFPDINDQFITWQSSSAGTWQVYVYDIASGSISQVSTAGDGKFENPRFALLFENRKGNGEIETVGYDVATGQRIPIKSGAASDHVPASQLPQDEKNKALPTPSGTSTSTPVKNPSKDDEGSEPGV